MKSKSITDVYQSEIESLSSAFDRLLRDFDVDANHDFRTGIKKLRAFLRLTDLSLPDRSNKIPRPIKAFYHLTGELRNLQLQSERVDQICNTLLIDAPSTYEDALYHRQSIARKNVEHAATDVSFHKFSEELCRHIPPPLHRPMKRRFVRGGLTRLAGLLAFPVLSDEALHEVRKILKDLVYNYEYLGTDIHSLVPPPLNDLESMEDLTRQLGDLHDLSTALMFLAPPYANVPENENESLSQLRSHIALAREDLRRAVLPQLSGLQAALNREGYAENTPITL